MLENFIYNVYPLLVCVHVQYAVSLDGHNLGLVGPISTF